MVRVSNDYRYLLGRKFCSVCREDIVCEHDNNKLNLDAVQKRISNRSIDSTLNSMLPFYNYNSTQIGYFHNREYAVQHWATTMFAVNIDTKEIIHFELPFISMTSSILVGRILRSNLVELDKLREYVLGGGSAITPLDDYNKRKWSRYVNNREKYALERA